MAHFAELDENNIVVRVLVVNNEVITVDGVENEQLGVEFCHNLFGGKWVQTSYNATFRGLYAAKGNFYNEAMDQFELTNE